MAKRQYTKKISKASQEVEFFSVEQGGDENENKYAKIAKAATEGMRRNKSSTTIRSDRFKNIEDSFSPFNTSGDNKITAFETVDLCQKAYYNFPIFRNTIELMVEFSTSNIYYRGGSAKARSFFQALFDKTIGIFSLQDRFFREYYRSGNVFIYRSDAKIRQEDLKTLTQVFGAESSSIKLPIKYVILNPADINFEASYSFSNGNYNKVLNSYEVELLKSRKTKEDQLYFKSLPPDVQKEIEMGNSQVLLPLKGDNFYPIFYKKQDYEPFAVPMAYGVLGDINWKEELKKMDMALARVIQQVVLLVTTGNEPDKGGINQKHIENLRKIFENQSVGRVLVADYTTKAEFVIPQISDILDPKKYQIVNEDIMMGLHNILIGDEKFANQSIKVQLFVEKLRQARMSFLNDFLIPEIKRLSQELGFKNYPTPYFEDFDLKNEVEFARIYTRLAEIGILTPEETIKAIETGVLPDSESSIESQRKLKEFKQDELYQPIAPNNNDKINGEAGRPSGTTRPQSTKNVAPIGASFSSKKLVNNYRVFSSLEEEVKKQLLSKNKLKKLSAKQVEVAENLALIIAINEDIDNWLKVINQYVDSPKDFDANKLTIVNDIAKEHGIDLLQAVILTHSKNA